MEVDVSDLVVGDIFVIQTGEIFPVDGILIESNGNILQIFI